MNEVIVMQGLPGSGKTTWAREFIENNEGYIRVNRDDIRAMLQNGKYDPESETFVKWLRNIAIHGAIEQDMSVIVDDTNLHPQSIRDIEAVVQRRCRVVVQFVDTPLHECIRRDALRDSPVGAERIREMDRNFALWEMEEEERRMQSLYEETEKHQK